MIIITLASLLLLSLVMLMVFTTGTLCGHFIKKRRQATKKSLAESTRSHADVQNVLYEEVFPTGQHIELKQNTAYGPVQHHFHNKQC